MIFATLKQAIANGLLQDSTWWMYCLSIVAGIFGTAVFVWAAVTHKAKLSIVYFYLVALFFTNFISSSFEWWARALVMNEASLPFRQTMLWALRSTPYTLVLIAFPIHLIIKIVRVRKLAPIIDDDLNALLAEIHEKARTTSTVAEGMSKRSNKEWRQIAKSLGYLRDIQEELKQRLRLMAELANKQVEVKEAKKAKDDNSST